MSEKELVKQLLLSSNYWALNKTVVKVFGIETAFLLANLAEAEQIMPDNDGWFYQTSDTLEELTTLSRYKQDKAIEDLEKSGILERDVRGIPAKRYFKLDYKSLANKIVNNSQTRVKKNDKLELKKLTTNKESINKEIKNKETTKESPAKAERVPFKKIIDYLNEQADRSYSYKAKTNRTLIRARWNGRKEVDKGISDEELLEQFKSVIDKKVADANDTEHFFKSEYLRPSTLFSESNFDKYLNQPERTKQGSQQSKKDSPDFSWEDELDNL